MIVDQSTCIRLMIVDDHTVVRGGLKYFLLAFKDMELVAEASNGEETLRLCNQLRPDVVLMDMMMPGMDGIATTQAIRQRHPQTQVIALTSFQDEELVRKALQAGAIGYLLKNISIDDLAKAIRDAYAGRPTLAPEATHQLIQSSGRPAPPTYHLTSRELEVLALVVAGLSNIEIGHRLSVSHHTVRHHISSILTKLGAANRAEAAALAVQHRLIT